VEKGGEILVSIPHRYDKNMGDEVMKKEFSDSFNSS